MNSLHKLFLCAPSEVQNAKTGCPQSIKNNMFEKNNAGHPKSSWKLPSVLLPFSKRQVVDLQGIGDTPLVARELADSVLVGVAKRILGLMFSETDSNTCL